MSPVDEQQICIVCFEEVGGVKGCVITPCSHVYCVSCFAQHMRIINKCAYCRAEIAPVVNRVNNVILSAERRGAIARVMVDDFVLTNGVGSIYDEIYDHIKKRVYDQCEGRITRAVRATLEKASIAMRDVDITFDLWSIVVSAINVTSDIYEHEDVFRDNTPDTVDDDDATVDYATQSV